MKRTKSNPAVSASQYGLAEAVLSGRSTAMPKKVARELIDKTPAKTRSRFAKQLAERRGNPKAELDGVEFSYASDDGHVHWSSDWVKLFELANGKYKRLFKYSEGGPGSYGHRSLMYVGGRNPTPEVEKAYREAMAADKMRGEKNAAKSRFEKCVESVTKRGGARSPRGVCAAAGRKKYGMAQFAAMARAGRKRAGNNPHVATLSEAGARADIHELKGYGKKEYEAIITGGKQTVGEVFDSIKGAMTWARIKLHEVAHANPRTRRNQLESILIGDAALGGKGSIVSKLGKALGKKSFSLRGNPEAPSEEMYQVFHGFPSDEVLEYVQNEHEHGWLWGVGTLVSLEVMGIDGKRTVELIAPDPASAKFDDVVQVAANELSLLARLAEGEDLTPEMRELLKGYEEYAKFGDQIFFVGGDQSLSFDFLIDKFHMSRDDIRERMLIGTVTKMTYRTRKTFEAEGKQEIDFWHKLGGEHSKGVCPVLIYKPLSETMEVAGGRYFVAPGDRSLKGVSPGIVG